MGTLYTKGLAALEPFGVFYQHYLVFFLFSSQAIPKPDQVGGNKTTKESLHEEKLARQPADVIHHPVCPGPTKCPGTLTLPGHPHRDRNRNANSDPG